MCKYLRENEKNDIYLNKSDLSMPTCQIQKKFNKIEILLKAFPYSRSKLNLNKSEQELLLDLDELIWNRFCFSVSNFFKYSVLYNGKFG